MWSQSPWQQLFASLCSIESCGDLGQEGPQKLEILGPLALRAEDGPLKTKSQAKILAVPKTSRCRNSPPGWKHNCDS
ncbi:Hypothetical predicted protein [Podarcis lilfordi]|uniref:Uncharacterized protein n=1 Tax=Podarcis lilfordi TaxID=74358 RepID=A0AA35KA84_9SAUR|nr:Hypothetical predicted protein [Podarcis lilfordi]